MSQGREIISLVAQRQDLDQFRKKNWVGTFEEYLDLVRQRPEATRNAFERVYDMIMTAGTTVYEESRGVRRVHYKFFDDPENEGRDAVFGLDEPLHVIPERFREEVLSRLNVDCDENGRKVRIVGELCPYCRFMYTDRLKK